MTQRARKLAPFAAMLCILSFVLAACGSGNSSPASTAKPSASTAPSGTATPVPAPTATPKLLADIGLKTTNPDTAPEPSENGTGGIPAADLAATPKRGGTLRATTHLGSGNMDPHFDPNPAAWRIFPRAYGSGLVAWSLKINGPEPDLADSWELAPDGKDWIFHLHKGVKFQNKAPVNGRDLTAEDIKFSLDRVSGLVRRPGDASINYPRFNLVQEFQVVDPSTIRVVMKQVDNQFLLEMMMEYTVILPKEAAVDGNFSEAKTLIGSGPFLIDSALANGFSKMVRNPNWFRAGTGQKPYMDAVEWSTLDAAAQTAAINTHQLDFWILSSGAARPFLNKPELRVYGSRGDLVGTSGVNVSVNNPPVTDIRLRQAINLGMDRDELITVVYDGLSVVNGPLGGYWQPWFWNEAKVRSLDGMGPTAGKQADYDKAKQILKDAGFANGLSLTIECGAIAGTCELLQQQMTRIGITLKVNIAPPNMDRNAAYLKDKMMVYASTGGGHVPDYAVTQDYLCNGGNHPSGVCDDQIETLWKAYRQTLDVNKMVSTLDQIQQRVWDLRISLGAGRTQGFLMSYKDVRGWRNCFYCVIMSNNQLQNMWLDR